jgi:hypothetical protein
MDSIIEANRQSCGSAVAEIAMRVSYGISDIDDWCAFALGSDRDNIWRQYRERRTQIIRIPLFSRNNVDPVKDWNAFTANVQAVLNTGATPMITFAKFSAPYDNLRAVRFAERCADVVWGCIEQWGGEAVRDWYWCVWNEPNSEWVSGDLSFEQYRSIYLETAHRILRWLSPFLNGRKPLIGGPAVDGFQPFWLDWIWRFANEIDNSLIGFVSWHRYGDWRAPGEWGAPSDDTIYRRLLMSRTRDYETRAQSVGRILKGRKILNICDNLAPHSRSHDAVGQKFNQTMFGAAYYVSALLHLIRGGADAEMSCSGISEPIEDPIPVFHAKKLLARFIRYGDWISFPACRHSVYKVNTAMTRRDGGRRSAFVVHLTDEPAKYNARELTSQSSDFSTLLKLDNGTGNRVVETSFGGTVTFNGYGFAVLTSEVPHE